MSEISDSSLTFLLSPLMCNQVLSLNTSTEIFLLAFLPFHCQGNIQAVVIPSSSFSSVLSTGFPASRRYSIQSVLPTTPRLIFIKYQFVDSFLISKNLQEAVVESPREQEDPRKAHVSVRIGAVDIVRRCWFREGFPEEWQVKRMEGRKLGSTGV